jgi:hypothetical protein
MWKYRYEEKNLLYETMLLAMIKKLRIVIQDYLNDNFDSLDKIFPEFSFELRF